MKRVLSQQEIDAILGKARAGNGLSAGSDSRVIQPCNFRTAGQMSNQHARLITTLYEGFARMVSNSLGAYLRVRFEMALASVEQIPVRDFLGSFQEGGYLTHLSLSPGEISALMQIDQSLVFPIIDLLLGGRGSPSPQAREMTEIDAEIMEGVAQIICRQLESTWRPMGITILLDRQQKTAQVYNVFPQNEKLMVLTFEIKLNETTGTVILSFPTSFAGAMLREISADPRKRTRLRSERKPGLRERVLHCAFNGVVGIAGLKVSLREIVALRPGSVLNLGFPVKHPASLILGGREVFAAVPVRSGKQRAAQLSRRLSSGGEVQE